MIKYCKDCNIEIADTNYDTLGRFNAVKRCPECQYQHKLNLNRRYRRKKKLERELEELSGMNDLEETAKYSRRNKRLVVEQNNLLKQENKLLRESNAQLRAKNNPRTGDNQ